MNRARKIAAPFHDASERAKESVCTHSFVITEQADVKCFRAEEVEGLLDDKLYKLTESWEFTQGLFRHLLGSSTSTVLLTPFVKQQSESALSNEWSSDKMWLEQ